MGPRLRDPASRPLPAVETSSRNLGHVLLRSFVYNVSTFQTYYVEYYARYLEEYEAALANASARDGGGFGLDGEMNHAIPLEDALNDDGDVGVLGGGGGGEDFSSNGTASFCAIM